LEVLLMTQYWPNCRDIGGVDYAKRLSQRGDCAGCPDRNCSGTS